MTNYRLGYSYNFLADDIKHENEIIGGVSINVIFKLCNTTTNNEHVFQGKEQGKELGIHSFCLRDTQDKLDIPYENLTFSDELEYLKIVELCDLLKVHFDEYSTEYFSFKAEHKILKDNDYYLNWEVVSYQKDVLITKSSYEDKNISKEKFIDIISKNINEFNSKDNKPASSLSYFFQEIKEDELNKNNFEVAIDKSDEVQKLFAEWNAIKNFDK